MGNRIRMEYSRKLSTLARLSAELQELTDILENCGAKEMSAAEQVISANKALIDVCGAVLRRPRRSGSREWAV